MCISQLIVALTPQSLCFNASGTFKIVQFTDTHLGEPHLNTAAIIANMSMILDSEKPDFVVFTVDNVTDSPVRDGLEILTELVATRHIPYIMVFGNHDSELKMGIGRAALGKMIVQLPGYYNQQPIKGITGVTNYVLEIKNSKGNLLHGCI